MDGSQQKRVMAIGHMTLHESNKYQNVQKKIIEAKIQNSKAQLFTVQKPLKKSLNSYFIPEIQFKFS